MAIKMGEVRGESFFFVLTCFLTIEKISSN